MKNHEIDYRLYGEEMQFVEIELDPEETVVCRKWQLYDDERGNPNGHYFW